jgi:hypothetical protein
MSDLITYRPPSAGELEQAWLLADRFSRTEFVPAALKGKPEAVMACMLAGRELGIGPMQALQKIHIIQGRPTLSAELMASLVRRAGHRIRTIERSATAATVEGARSDDPDAAEKITWTIEDAKRAKLDGKDNWKAYPSAMLWARAVSALCRQLFPDVLAGMSYTPDEIGPASTDATWGDPVTGEVYDPIEEDPGAGAVTTTPAPAPAARMRAAQQEATATRQRHDPTPGGVPTLEQVYRLRSVSAAKDLLYQAPASFPQHVKAIVSEGDDEDLWREFWRDASLTTWKHTLEHAIDETSAAGASPVPPSGAPAADPNAPGVPAAGGARGQTSEVSSDREADATPDPNLLDEGEPND